MLNNFYKEGVSLEKMPYLTNFIKTNRRINSNTLTQCKKMQNRTTFDLCRRKSFLAIFFQNNLLFAD